MPFSPARTHSPPQPGRVPSRLEKPLAIKRRLYPKPRNGSGMFPGPPPSFGVREYLCKRQWLILLTPLAIVLSFFARSHPQWVETVYSTKIYPVLSQSIGSVSALVPFSLAECIIVGLVILGFYLVISLIYRLTRQDAEHTKAWFVARFLSTVLSIGSVIYFLFVLDCGLNYSRYPFTYYSGLNIRDSSAQELSSLCAELIEEANNLSGQVERDENGITRLSGGMYQTAADAKAAFDTLSQGYPVLAGQYAQPKPVFFSRMMSRAQITGVFFPLTFEANVNREAPEYTIPATMCHELSHLRGFMREDEANFIGYLACRQSESAEFQYSGVMLALVHSMNSLYSVDQDAFFALAQQYSPGVAMDFQYNNLYWQQFEGAVAEVSSKVNDSYLKANFQSDGVQSYGRMVDLLLADYRSRHGLE